MAPKPDSPYQRVGTEIGALVEEKNQAYGSAFDRAGEILERLYPNGIMPEQYSDMLAVTRIVDKLFRIATDRDALGETPFRDISGYGILGAVRVEREREQEKARLRNGSAR